MLGTTARSLRAQRRHQRAASAVDAAPWSCCRPTRSTASAPTPSTRRPSPALLRRQGARPRHAGAGAGRLVGDPRRAGRPTCPRRRRDLVAGVLAGRAHPRRRHAPSLAWDLGDADGTVAVRMPLHPVASSCWPRTGPMAVSSANVSGQPPAPTCDSRPTSSSASDVAVVPRRRAVRPGRCRRRSSTARGAARGCCGQGRDRRRAARCRAGSQRLTGTAAGRDIASRMPGTGRPRR